MIAYPTKLGEISSGYKFVKKTNYIWKRVPTMCIRQGTICAPTECFTEKNPAFLVCKPAGVLYQVVINNQKENLLCACEGKGCHFEVSGTNGCMSVTIN
jgi:hypothetical protein